MPTINMDSILAKAKAHTASSNFQKQLEERTDSMIMTDNMSGGALAPGGHMVTISGVSVAAAKFIDVLKSEIESLGAGGGFSNGKLGGTAVSALTELEHGSPYKVGKNKYQIEVWFSNDLHRDSLAPDEYDGVDNIAALLNNGYNAGNTIYGIWLGHHNDQRIASLAQRDGAHFIESAIRNYMANYAREYGVVDIEVSDVYK